MQGKLATLEELETMIDEFSSGKIAERFMQAAYVYAVARVCPE
jgi:hypothetical protein